jgi:hypothetical protein
MVYGKHLKGERRKRRSAPVIRYWRLVIRAAARGRREANAERRTPNEEEKSEDRGL